MRELPPVDLLAAGVELRQPLARELEEGLRAGPLAVRPRGAPEYEARVTRSERDRATANCVLHYAAQHHPLLILVEAMPTVTAEQIPGLLTAAGTIKNNGSIDEAEATAPTRCPTRSGARRLRRVSPGLLFSGWYKQNGSHRHRDRAAPAE